MELRDICRGVVGFNPVLDLPLSEGAGTIAYDRSGWNNHGTLYSLIWEKHWRDWMLFFDPDTYGTGCYIDCGDDFLDVKDEFTIIIWLWTNDTVRDGTAFSYATTVRDNEVLLFNYRSLDLWIGGVSASTGIAVNDGVWHCVAWKWRSIDGQTKLVVDGVVKYTGTLRAGYTIQHGTDRRLFLGQEQDTVGGGLVAGQAFKGYIAQVLWLKKCLTDDQIAFLATLFRGERRSPPTF